MSEENFDVVRRWFEEVWNSRDESVITELVNEDSFCEADGDRLVGPDDFLNRLYRPFISAFPDLKVRIDRIEDVDGCVLAHWTAEGTHKGEGLGCAATDKPVTFQGWTRATVRDGKLVEGLQESNIPERLKELAGG
jgi:steroid delta-isomerase-like uncharacterized protein